MLDFIVIAEDAPWPVGTRVQGVVIGTRATLSRPGEELSIKQGPARWVRALDPAPVPRRRSAGTVAALLLTACQGDALGLGGTALACALLAALLALVAWRMGTRHRRPNLLISVGWQSLARQVEGPHGRRRGLR